MANTRSGNSNSSSASRAGRSGTGRSQKSATPASSRIPSGRKGGASALSHPNQITAAELATHRMVQAHLEAQRKAAKDAEDAGKYSIRARNQELLDAEGSESAEEEAPARKRKKTSADVILSDDEEQGIAAGLPPVRATSLALRNADVEPMEEDEISTRSSAGEDLHDDLDGVDVDDVDVEMDLASADSDLSNEITLQDAPAAASVTRRQTARSKSAAPTASHPQTPTTSSSSNTSKVVEKDFSPRTLRLALSAKAHVRTRSIFDEPFPRNNKISRINFAWKTIKESAAASSDHAVRFAYKRATEDVNVKTKLMKFTLYGRTGLISSIISKAREKVRAYYGFSGDADAVKKDVEWLLTKSHFTYGGIDLRAQTVDTMKPFGAQIIVDIIKAQWFPSTSRSKLDLETTNRIYDKRDLPLNAILLVVTAIEHALKEWSSTGRKACQITFSEDTARASFERHLRHWKFFESQTKAWPAWWRKTILDQILANHSNLDLNGDDNDFADLDFSGLDRLAGYEDANSSICGVQTAADSLRNSDVTVQHEASGSGSSGSGTESAI